MLLVWLMAAGLQVSVPAPVQSPVAEEPATGPALWSGLRTGMSAEQAASALRQVDGVRAVKVTQKKNKPPKLDVSYVADGVDVGFGRAKVTTYFEGAKLSEVDLDIDQCLSAAKAGALNLVTTLKTKYGAAARESVADPDNGAITSQRLAFWNEETRVRVSERNYNPAQGEASVPGSGAAGAIADIFGAIASNEAEKACPLDAGARALWTINYSSQPEFVRVHALEEAERAAKLKKATDGL